MNYPSKRKGTYSTSSKTKINTLQHIGKHCKQHISQRIHIEKQEFKCIINFNTTVCDHKSKHAKKSKEGHKSRKKIDNKQSRHKGSFRNIVIKNRIIPQCFRRASTPYENRINEVLRRKTDYDSRERGRRTCTLAEMKDEGPRYSTPYKHNNRHNNFRKEKAIKTWSSISSSPLKDDFSNNITYENISSASFETNTDKPVSHRRIKHCKQCRHSKKRKQNKSDKESKLDTLIRRTKERERKLVEQSRKDYKTWFTSTPIHNEFSPGDFPVSFSELDMSIASRSTLVLEMEFPYLHQSSETEKQNYQVYSPSSPIKHEDYNMRIPENINCKLVNIKYEPMMDIAAYSPTRSSTDLTLKLCESTFSKKRVKKERPDIKAEPLFSSGLSPVYLENENSRLQFCKIEETIKSEIV